MTESDSLWSAWGQAPPASQKLSFPSDLTPLISGVAAVGQTFTEFGESMLEAAGEFRCFHQAWTYLRAHYLRRLPYGDFRVHRSAPTMESPWRRRVRRLARG